MKMTIPRKRETNSRNGDYERVHMYRLNEARINEQ